MHMMPMPRSRMPPSRNWTLLLALVALVGAIDISTHAESQQASFANVKFSDLPHSRQKLWKAVVSNDHGTIEKLLVSKGVSPDFGAHGISLLHQAVISLDDEALELLISYTSTVDTLDEKGNTPLHWSIAKQTSSARLLVEANANVDAVGSLGTPLTVGIHKDVKLELLQLLLDNNASVSKFDRDGLGPVHIAAGKSTADAFYILVDAGADPLQPDMHGCTPLHHAVASGSRGVILFLIGCGADVNSQCGANSALQISLDRGRLDIYRLLLAHEADTRTTRSRNLPSYAGLRVANFNMSAHAYAAPAA